MAVRTRTLVKSSPPSSKVPSVRTVASANIVDGTIVAGDLADGAVAQAKLAANVVGNGPAFRAYANSTTTVSHATFTKITLAAEDFDTNSNFASSRFTPSVAGYYNIIGGVYVAAGAIALSANIYKNGALHTSGPSNNASAFTSSVSDLVYLNGTTDYVELYGYHFAGAGQNRTIAADQTSTFLSGCLVRAA